MFTNTSKFRVYGKYGLFTIPKGILNGQGWKPGDLIEFWSTDEKVIYIKKMGKEEIKKLGKNYNKKIYKKLARFGGKTGTYGIKSLPGFLMREFKPKNGQKIYFLPARYTWFSEYYPLEALNNIIFAAFKPNYLKVYEKSNQKSKEEQEAFYKDRIKEKSIEKYKGKNKEENNYTGHDFGLFNGTLEYTEKNSKSAKRAARWNRILSIEKIKILISKIKKFEGYIKKIKSSKHPKKEEIIKDLKEIVLETNLTIKELKINPEKIFYGLTKEDIEYLKYRKIKEKRNGVENIKRRNNAKNLSST